ncbi:MAG: hypothetical protein ACLGG9_01295, partial [Thermoleophilia bacterium]
WRRSTVEAERELHGRLRADSGNDTASVAETEPSPHLPRIHGFLRGARAPGERHEAFAPILPCHWTCRRVGRALAERGSPGRGDAATRRGSRHGERARPHRHRV